MSTSLSRSSSTSPLGKLSYEVKTGVPEVVGEELERMARAAGMTVREYARDVLTIHAVGYDHVRRLYQDRLEILSKIGAEKAES